MVATNLAKLQIVGAQPAWDEELRLWLDGYIKKYPHKSTAVLSRSDHIGASKAALDAYLAGVYFLPKEQGGMGVAPGGKSRVEDLIRAYRDKEEGGVREGVASVFVETRAWQQFQHACQTAINEKAIVVVYAKPGIGKSRCLSEYATQKMTTQPVKILCSANITPRYFVQRIANDLRLDDRPPTARLEDNIAERLRRNPRPLLIDQANYLNEKSLGTICYLWEVAQVPIILIGTKDLYDLFMTSRLTQDVRAQLSSRVAMHYPLLELGDKEIKAIVRRALGDGVTDADIALILQTSGGVFRHVAMVLPRIADLARRNRDQLAAGTTRMETIIKRAFERLFLEV